MRVTPCACVRRSVRVCARRSVRVCMRACACHSVCARVCVRQCDTVCAWYPRPEGFQSRLQQCPAVPASHATSSRSSCMRRHPTTGATSSGITWRRWRVHRFQPRIHRPNHQLVHSAQGAKLRCCSCCTATGHPRHERDVHLLCGVHNTDGGQWQTLGVVTVVWRAGAAVNTATCNRNDNALERRAIQAAAIYAWEQ